MDADAQPGRNLRSFVSAVFEPLSRKMMGFNLSVISWCRKEYMACSMYPTPHTKNYRMPGGVDCQDLMYVLATAVSRVRIFSQCIYKLAPSETLQVPLQPFWAVFLLFSLGDVHPPVHLRKFKIQLECAERFLIVLKPNDVV